MPLIGRAIDRFAPGTMVIMGAAFGAALINVSRVADAWSGFTAGFVGIRLAGRDR